MLFAGKSGASLEVRASSFGRDAVLRKVRSHYTHCYHKTAFAFAEILKRDPILRLSVSPFTAFVQPGYIPPVKARLELLIACAAAGTFTRFALARGLQFSLWASVSI